MKSLLITFLGALLLTTNVIAVDATGNYAVWGIGSKSCFAFNSATVNYLNSETAKPDKEEETLLSKIKFWEKTDTEEKPTEDLTERIIDIVAPLGKGQRQLSCTTLHR